MSGEPLSDERLAEIRRVTAQSNLVVPTGFATDLLDEINRLKQSQPQYHDRPTVPGKWIPADKILMIDADDLAAIDDWSVAARKFYGPIPQESDE